MLEGTLPRERLLLTHALGYVPARIALGKPPPEPPGPWDPLPPPETLERWGRGVGPQGPAAMLRVATAIVRAVDLPTATTSLRQGLEAVDAFFAAVDRSPEEGAALRDRLEAAAAQIAREALTQEASSRARAACLAALPLLRALLTLLAGGPPERAVLDAFYLRVLEQAALAWPHPLEELKDCVRAEICAWALSEEGGA